MEHLFGFSFLRRHGCFAPIPLKNTLDVKWFNVGEISSNELQK